MIELNKHQFYKLALFLSGIFAICLYFLEGMYCYRIWYAAKLIIILFLFPSWVTDENRQARLAQLYCLLFMAGLPFSISATIIEGLASEIAFCYEIFLLLLSCELIWLNSVTRWKSYQVIAFIMTTAPLFFYFLYLDIWRYSLPNLLNLSPLGSIWNLTDRFPYFIFIPLSYIMLYKLIILIFRLFFANGSQI